MIPEIPYNNKIISSYQVAQFIKPLACQTLIGKKGKNRVDVWRAERHKMNENNRAQHLTHYSLLRVCLGRRRVGGRRNK